VNRCRAPNLGPPGARDAPARGDRRWSPSPRCPNARANPDPPEVGAGLEHPRRVAVAHRVRLAIGELRAVRSGCQTSSMKAPYRVIRPTVLGNTSCVPPAATPSRYPRGPSPPDAREASPSWLAATSPSGPRRPCTVRCARHARTMCAPRAPARGPSRRPRSIASEAIAAGLVPSMMQSRTAATV
jgi:hypothetical protein